MGNGPWCLSQRIKCITGLEISFDFTADVVCLLEVFFAITKLRSVRTQFIPLRLPYWCLPHQRTVVMFARNARPSIFEGREFGGGRATDIFKKQFCKSKYGTHQVEPCWSGFWRFRCVYIWFCWAYVWAYARLRTNILSSTPFSQKLVFSSNLLAIVHNELHIM